MHALALVSKPNLESLTAADLRAVVTARLEQHADAIEALLALLDFMDGDPDLEPTLGAPEAKINLPWGQGFAIVGEGSQLRWAQGSRLASDDGAEQTNEDGGDILDECEGTEAIPGGTEISPSAIWWQGGQR